MVKKTFVNEREGQMEFLDQFRIDYVNNPVLVDNTDGIWNGNLLEFKMVINNLNMVLMQAIKYLSRMRIKGEDVPENILLVDLSRNICYVYHASDYRSDINQIYNGAASKDNSDFKAGDPLRVIHLDDESMVDTVELQNILKSTDYMPVDIDENCIVGWAERYYRENPNAKKSDFLGDEEGQIKVIGEIRDPKHFKGKILPYVGKTNERFKYLMDKLNDNLQKKDLGAYYTPVKYCEKAAELVRQAIQRVPAGNDYIILDRCAGTGNLEAVLTDEELSHCVLSTYEYYEYKVLLERLGDKARLIMPPLERTVVYEMGFVKNANALSKSYIENALIRRYVDDPNCTVILLENVPYRDITAKDKVKTKSKKVKGQVADEDFVYNEFIANKTDQASHREIANLFIWSAAKYYLRQPTDSYILFSPVKYFKSLNLEPGRFLNGFLFNRKHFHASPSAISCILWGAEPPAKSQDTITLEAFDIQDDELVKEADMEIRKVSHKFNEYNDRRSLSTDIKTDVFVKYSTGYPFVHDCPKQGVYGDDIIGFLRATSYNLDTLSRCLTTAVTYDGLTQSYGFYLRRDNYLEKLPMFVAKLFPQDLWYMRDVVFTTSDGGLAYTKDKDFLHRCLFYTCLTNANKCMSFQGADGHHYINQLCLDTDTLASRELAGFKMDEDEKELLEIWNNILTAAKSKPGYDAKQKYGISQIIAELDTFTEMLDKGKKKKVYADPIFHGNIETLYAKLKTYYTSHIQADMFKYQLLK